MHTTETDQVLRQQAASRMGRRVMTDKDFQLDGAPAKPTFQLDSEVEDRFPVTPEQQGELFLVVDNAEQPEVLPQLELDGMEKPVHGITVWTGAPDGEVHRVKFRHANSLLESLESQSINVPYQCREGYCGGCRTQLLSGDVAYLQEPMAWLNEGEILPCCCVPKTDLVLKLKG